MPKTYTYGDAVTLIRRSIAPLSEDDYAAEACNMATRHIWTRYDWRESIAQLPSFCPVPGEQDHGYPAVTVPEDFMGIREAYLVHLNSDPPRVKRLTYLMDIDATTASGHPESISFHEATKSFRLFPRVAHGIGSPDWIVCGTYKKTPPKVTSSNMGSVLIPFDDSHYQRFCEVLRWAAWNLVGDPRAGEVDFAKGGGAAFRGQRAKAEVAIQEMAESEGLEQGTGQISPEQGLVHSTWIPRW